MTRFAPARKRIVLLTAAGALCASTGAVVAALVLTPPRAEPHPRAHRDLGAPAPMLPADADSAPCDATPGVCIGPSAFRTAP